MRWLNEFAARIQDSKDVGFEDSRDITRIGNSLLTRRKAEHEMWRSGEGETTKIGYVNPNGQQCCGTRGVAGNDHCQSAYKIECGNCGHVYGANGSDIHLRKCPECQGGAPGIRYWGE